MAMPSAFSSGNTFRSNAAFGGHDDADEFGAFAAAAPASSPPAATATATSSGFAPPPPAPFATAAAAAVAVALPEISFADDEYDNPFADIVHEAPKSANTSRTSSFSATGSSSSAFATATSAATAAVTSSSASALASDTAGSSASTLPSHAQTSAVSLAFGSPLLSFSPVATPSAAATAPSTSPLIPDIFASSSSSSTGGKASSAPIAEAELLSFSPLLLSSSAPASGPPSSLSSFLLDSPVALSASSPPTSRFTLPPPRAASTPALSPVRSSSGNGAAATTKSASFAAHVSVGELLSFSPVASASATAFSDSFASSSGAATASFFGNDELFSLSTPDLTMELSAPAHEQNGSVTEATDLAAPASGLTLGDLTSVSAAFLSPVALADVSLASSTVSFRASATAHDGSATATALPLFETVSMAAEGESELLGHAPSESSERPSNGFQTPASEYDEVGLAAPLNDGEDSVADASSPIEDDEASAATDATEGHWPKFDELQPSPAGYSQFAFISHESSPAASASDELSSSFAAPSSSSYSATLLPSPTSADLTEASSSLAALDAMNTPTNNRLEGDSVDYASFSSSSSPESSNNAIEAISASDIVATVQPADAAATTEQLDVLDTAGSSSPATFAFDRDDAPSSSTHSVDASPATDSEAASADAFGAFGVAPAHASASFAVIGATDKDDDAFGDFAHPAAFSGAAAPATGDDDDYDDDAFGGFGQSSSALNGARNDDDDDDDFGDFGGFGQSASGADDDDDDFGDFGQSSGGPSAAADDDDFGDFGTSAPSSFGATTQHTGAGDDDDGFGDFSATPATTAPALSVAPVNAPATSLHAPLATPSPDDLESFFRQAFPALSPASVPLEPAPQVPALSLHTQHTKELFQDSKHGRSDVLVTAIYRTAVERYFHDASSSSTDPDGAAVAPSPTDSTEQYQSELKARRLKHLKYVLTEKIQDAARHDGLFPHGSAQHHALLSLVNSDDESKMREALTRVQDALFTSSVNDAMMRMARQAALSAKAKIAEQAAHQQASSRGSLLATTRQLLSRSGGGTATTASPAASGSSQDASDNAAAAAAASHTSNGNSSGGDDSGGETSSTDSSSGRRLRSGSNESEVGATGHSKAPGSGGGLMRKFQDRFSSFSSSRGRPRFVSLRRMGQSGDDVRKMELNLDAISGGLDEVKWKCAVFLYDVDEVAQVAPSQISILAYPSKEVLAGKSDRAALLKLLKPGAIWTVDIGASNNDVLNAW